MSEASAIAIYFGITKVSTRMGADGCATSNLEALFLTVLQTGKKLKTDSPDRRFQPEQKSTLNLGGVTLYGVGSELYLPHCLRP